MKFVIFVSLFAALLLTTAGPALGSAPFHRHKAANRQKNDTLNKKSASYRKLGQNKRFANSRYARAHSASQHATFRSLSEARGARPTGRRIGTRR